MRTMLPLTTIDIKAFTWNRSVSGFKGVAEESSLPEHLASRVYTDAADFGFLIRGKTGRILLFTHVQTLKDLEGDVVANVFQCSDLPHVEVHVLND